jgi:predicted NBD/HSP70 family sugar kinase
MSEIEQQAYLPILAANDRQRVSTILQSTAGSLPLCRALAQEVIQALAAAVANVIYIVQPDVIVIGGALGLMSPELYNDLAAAIATHLPSLIDNHVIIQQAKLSSPNSAAVGATRHFLQSYLTDTFADVLQVAQNGN